MAVKRGKETFSGFNKPKRTPSHPTKSHAVLAKQGDKVKLIRFGQQGVSGAGKNPRSDKDKARRKSFLARHAKNIARGKMSAAFLKMAVEGADTVVIRTKLRDSKGKFGRVLGTVVCDGEDINEAMIDAHLAAKYFGQNKAAIEAVHQANRTKLIEMGLFEPIDG